MIYGHLVVQDGMPDVLRAIESLYPVTDKILVVDGGSADGTWGLLQDRAKIYNLTLYQNPFTTIRAQRQFLLDKTPKDSWVVTIDQDEMISHDLQIELPKIIKGISIETLTAPRLYPYALLISYFTLMKDIKHYSTTDYLTIASKVFYNDKDLTWRNDFHCEPTYPRVEGRVDGKLVRPYNWCIFHFAWLDPKRMKMRERNNYKNYSPEEWDINNKVIKMLPDGVRV